MAIAVYENHIIENKMTELVNTKANINALFTVDNTLATDAGLKKIINKYTYSGKVEKLAKGAKNTTKGAVVLVTKEYAIERYQQTFTYNDMDIMADPYVLDVMTAGAADLMANHIRELYFAELAKVSNKATAAALNYDAIVDALAQIGREVESDMFVVMGLDGKAAIRKDADYKASKQGEILYTGQFGDICGVPCVCSKLVPAGKVYITAKDQVKHFVKKDGNVEQDRDKETKDNTVVYDRYGVMALVDETKSIELTIGG
jgi:hypothetical protein